jgi:hypothetical protein
VKRDDELKKNIRAIETTCECQYGVYLAPYKDEVPKCERRRDKEEKELFEREIREDRKRGKGK